MTHTQLRNRAHELASGDWQAALVVARRIDDPWFACQAVAAVARYAPEARVSPLADEAIRDAERADDPYRTVGASAWPLRALLERGKGSEVARQLARVLLLVPGIRPSPSRAQALFLVLSAVYPGGRGLWHPVHEEIMKLVPNAWHWRTKCVLSESILMVSAEDATYAHECAARLLDEKHRRKLVARLKAGKRLAPRGFFRE